MKIITTDYERILEKLMKTNGEMNHGGKLKDEYSAHAA